MKKTLIIILLLSTFNTLGETNKRQLAEELIVLTNVESTINVMYDQMGKMTQGMSQQLGIKPSESEFFEKYMARMFSLMKEEMNWEKMKEPTIEIYIKHYTEKELQDIVAFYKTKSGKSMVSKMPLVMEDSMVITQSMLKDFLPKMQALTKEMKEELAASRNSTK